MPGDDAEFVVSTTQEHNLKCPITRKILENPVTNKPCNHHYSKDAIMEMIRHASTGRAKQVNCPVTGCSAKVTAKSIEDNKDLELMIQREQLQAKKNSDEEDDDDVVDI